MKRSKAFILADSLVALTIISLSISFTFISQQCLNQQRQRQAELLTASRLAKEVSDELDERKYAKIHDGDYVASASLSGITVKHQGRKIIQVIR